MDSKRSNICFIMIMFCSTCIISSCLVNSQTNNIFDASDYGDNIFDVSDYVANIFDVSDYGSISTSKLTDSKVIFTDAWKKACATSNGVFLIPSGTYSLSDASFEGPCKGQTKFTLNGVVTAFPEVSTSPGYWIKIANVTGLIIDGTGKLDGNGAASWSRTCTSCEPPNLLSLEKVFNAEINNIKLVNSKLFHMNIHDSGQVTLNHLTITAPGNSPNTDGVHISRSTDIRVINSAIAVGDDCISMGDGSTNINITEISCGPGHGFSIGSLGKYSGEQDVSQITVTNCNLTNTLNGVRIKTIGNSPSSSTVHDVTFQNIALSNVDNPIIIDQHYCPTHKNCPTSESKVQIRSVKFIDVQGSSSKEVGVKLDCSGINPCQDIELSGINIKFKGQLTTATCSKAVTKFVGSNIPSKCS